MVGSVQRQHVDMYRKVLLRRRLLRKAVEGAAYVPFIGDGDLAGALYQDRRIYGADIDEDRCDVAWERLRGADIRVADCDHWPFEDVTEPFAVADFDAYADPYRAFEAFWGQAERVSPLVLFFTDGHRLEMTRRGSYIRPDGTHIQGLSLAEARKVYNSYFVREALPWVQDHISPWRVVSKAHYLRGQMLYWGVVVAHD